MQVVKRDSRTEPVQFDKITARFTDGDDISIKRALGVMSHIHETIRFGLMLIECWSRVD